MLGFGRRMLWRMRSAIRRLAADSQGLMALKFALAAPGVVPGLSWPALLVGLVLALKVYWVALAFAPRKRKTLN